MKTFRSSSNTLMWFLGLVVTVLLAACGSDGGGSTQPGTLSVSMTDAPACGYDEVNVTVSKVRIHHSGSADDKAAGWTDITLDPPRTINLLDLNDPTQAPKFALETLGETPLAAGHYTQLRLLLVENSNNPNASPDNYVVLSNIKTVEPLVTPSAIRSGIKLIHQFDVVSGQRVDLLLDFDACHSIVKTGSDKYILKPVIKVIPYPLNGIEGFVDKNLLVSNVIVSAQVNNGEVVRATVPNADGKFFLAHLLAGTAVKYDVVITADDHATAVISGVPVPSSTSITTISDSATPFSLANSLTQAINGTITLDPPDDDGTVIVAAKQTLNPGPTVTVKSQVATVKTDTPATIGDYGYSLTLPIGAPSRGQYGALPITLSATAPDQSAVAKMYVVRGSGQVGTTVYATQTPQPSAKDIVANQTQDFTLSSP